MRDIFTQFSHFKALRRGQLLFLFILLLGIGACQTAPVERFDKIKPGMTKAEVLEVMGGPRQSRRWRGLDRWTYWLFENNEKRIREVIFENGKSIYVGPPIKPEFSPGDPVDSSQPTEESGPKTESHDAGFREI